MTILPPPHERDTEPPDNPRESSMPPASLDPVGVVTRLLAVEEQVAGVRAEMRGINDSLRDISTALGNITVLYKRIATAVELLRKDAIGQRAEKAMLERVVDELKQRAMAHEEE